MLVHADGQDGVAEFLTQSRAEEKRAALERKIDADNEARRQREKAVAAAEAHMVKDANQKLEYALAEHQVKVIALFYSADLFFGGVCVCVCVTYEQHSARPAAVVEKGIEKAKTGRVKIQYYEPNVDLQMALTSRCRCRGEFLITPLPAAAAAAAATTAAVGGGALQMRSYARRQTLTPSGTGETKFRWLCRANGTWCPILRCGTPCSLAPRKMRSCARRS